MARSASSRSSKASRRSADQPAAAGGSAAPARAPRWRRRKEARRPEILAAALDVFAARGFAGARLEEVAARAGVTKGTLYLYFENKEALFKGLIDERLLPNIAMAEQYVRQHKGSAAALLTAVIDRLVHAIAETRAGMIPKLVISEAGNFPEIARFYVDHVIARGLGLFAAILTRGAERGEFRSVDAATAAPVLVGPLLLFALYKNVLEPHATRKLDRNRYLETYRDVVLRGLLARPAER